MFIITVIDIYLNLLFAFTTFISRLYGFSKTNRSSSFLPLAYTFNVGLLSDCSVGLFQHLVSAMSLLLQDPVIQTYTVHGSAFNAVCRLKQKQKDWKRVLLRVEPG
jgi:hypothetical protein